VNCFGDSGLKAALGSQTGVDPTYVAKRAGATPTQVFTFDLSAHLPGSLHYTNASSRAGGLLHWTPKLGQMVEISALTEAWNWKSIILVIVVTAIPVIGLLIAAALLWRSRRRRRRDGGGGAGRGAHVKPRRSFLKAVTSRP
jgi:hypothetical protein